MMTTLLRFRYIGTLSVSLVLLFLSTSSFAGGRCNANFEFDNRFSFPIKIPSYVKVKGNRGNYTENFNRSLLVQGKSRRTSQRKRLNKLDDGKLGWFTLTKVEIPSDTLPANTLVFPGQENNARLGHNFQPNQAFMDELGFKVNRVRCRDKGTITFVIKPLQNTAANRARVLALAGPNPSPARRADFFKRYLNFNPSTGRVYGQ